MVGLWHGRDARRFVNRVCPGVVGLEKRESRQAGVVSDRAVAVRKVLWCPESVGCMVWKTACCR